ncbi:MAG: metW [Parcubacteria group bacterium]|nr:metW [Parcubacteria group bacterium]
MNLTQFEDARWSTLDQPLEFRHRAALELIANGNVLDLGCGDCLLLEQLKRKAIDGTGLDLSGEAINKCHAKGISAQIHSFDQPLPYPDDSFDYVVLLDVLEHLYDPAVVLREAARVSSKYVIVGVPNFSSLPARIQTLLGNVPENNRPHKGHVYWFNDRVLQKVITAAGLTEVERKMNTFSVAKIFGDSVPRLAPNLFALSFVMKLEKDHE